MTLQEFLRIHTQEVQTALKSCEDHIQHLGSQRRAELEQAEGLQSEIDSKRKEEEEKRHLFDGSTAKIRDLERQIEELRRECERIAEERQTLTSDLTRAEDHVKAAAGQRKKARTQAESLEFQIKKLVEEKARLHDRLMSARLNAFHAYLEEFEARLVQQISAQEDRSEKIISQKKLEQARHEDAKVMEMYEARTELQKLLKVSNVPAVRHQLELQLREIDRQLENLFPGALSIETEIDGVAEIEEIFFASARESGTRIFLPISRTAWSALAKGESDFNASTALRLVWALSKGLELTGANARFQAGKDFVALDLDMDLGSSSDWPDIAMSLPGSGTIALLPSRIPHEVQEAIAYEDSHK